MTAIGDIWYRYEDERNAHLSISENGVDSYFSTLSIRLHEFTVHKVTPKGVWLALYGPDDLHRIGEGSRRFVLLGARKRFACPTKTEALQSLLARRKKQRRIYMARLASTNEAIRLIERMIETEREAAR